MNAAPLAPDAAVHGRDLALDAEAMGPRIARLLARHESVTVGRCERRRVKYRVGEGIRVLYAVELGGEARLVSLRTFAGDRSERVFARCARAAIDSGSVRGVAHDPELGAVLFAFPNDRKVGGLRALLGDAPPGVAAKRLVAYAPEKGATVRREGADGRTHAYAKAYAGDEGERTRRIHDSLREPAAAAGLRLPRALSYRERDRILECEALPGRPLAELAGPALRRGVLGLGAALARLHRIDPPPGAPPFERFAPARLLRAAEVITEARPDCAGLAQRLAERLVAEAPPPVRPVCLHGDVHAKNAVVGAGIPSATTGEGVPGTSFPVGLVDLDQAAAGPAVADLAGLLAALRYRRLTTAGGAGEDRLRDALLCGYARAGGRIDPGSLRWHVAAALLAERALRAITRVRPGGLAALPAILAEADAALGSRTGVAA